MRGDGDDDGRPTGQVSPDDARPPAVRTRRPARAPDPSTHATGRSPGMTRATTRLVGRAPIAATSARFCTAARRPTSSPEDHARRKCRSSTSTSVVTTNRPSGAATTAASSPGGRSVSAPRGRSGKIRARSASSDSSETRGPSDGAGVGGHPDTVEVRRAHGLRWPGAPDPPTTGTPDRPPSPASWPSAAARSRCRPTSPRTRPSRCARASCWRCPTRSATGCPQRDTTAQATTAWGDPDGAVVLRCGVEPLGPTTEHCQTVETPGGASVDWVVVEGDDGWTFTTYGREPAVELHVPAEVAAERSTAFVDQLGPAVALTEQVRSCV